MPADPMSRLSHRMRSFIKCQTLTTTKYEPPGTCNSGGPITFCRGAEVKMCLFRKRLLNSNRSESIFRSKRLCRCIMMSNIFERPWNVCKVIVRARTQLCTCPVGHDLSGLAELSSIVALLCAWARLRPECGGTKICDGAIAII